MNVRRMKADWKRAGPDGRLEHGANPGLISHFTKQGLLDIAARVLGRQEGHRRSGRRDQAARRRPARSTSWR